MSTSRFVLRAMVLTLAAMVLIFLLVGQLLAKSWRVETTRLLPVPTARVAALVQDLGSWSTWAGADVNLGSPTKRSVQGAPATVGQALVWEGPRGSATMTLTAVGSDHVEYALGRTVVGVDAPAPKAGGRIEWRQEGEQCQLRWIDYGDLDTLALRWFGWFGAYQHRYQQVQNSSIVGLEQKLLAR
jgi:hypothetical protein